MDESALIALHEAADFDALTEKTLRVYGAEIFGMLMALHDNETQARDAFADFGERLWRSLPTFRFVCSLRTWSYRLARAASGDVRRMAQREGRRNVPLTGNSRWGHVIDEVRSNTVTYLRTENKTAIARLREELSPDDQTLLVLRIDREMAWPDLARVFLDAETHDEARLKRESARLRKRFQLVKEQLIAKARRRGIVRP